MKIFRVQTGLVVRKVVEFPYGAKILSCTPSRTGHTTLIDLWFSVPEPGPITPKPERMMIDVAGTGHPIRDDITPEHFIGTCVMADDLVWHVFARPARDDEK